MTVSDFSHFAIYNGYLYIYRTPDSADYTLQVTGVELQDENTTTGQVFSINAELGWGLMYKALEKIAEINGDELKSNHYFGKGEYWKNEANKKASSKNKILNKVEPYNLR